MNETESLRDAILLVSTRAKEIGERWIENCNRNNGGYSIYTSGRGEHWIATALTQLVIEKRITDATAERVTDYIKVGDCSDNELHLDVTLPDPSPKQLDNIKVTFHYFDEEKDGKKK